jgi:hypothetical protein
MAYSAPELLLVGAAQNLVLTDSSDGTNLAPFCQGFEKEDAGNGPDYDATALW